MNQILQAKDRELAEAQQQLRQQVRCHTCAHACVHVCVCVCVCVCVFGVGRKKLHEVCVYAECRVG